MQEGNEQVGWQFTPGSEHDEPGIPLLKDIKPVQPVAWTASEYVAHDKTKGWFMLFGLIAVLGLGLIFFLTKDIISTLLLALLVGAFGFLAARKPQVLQYTLDNRGITIGQKFYPINVFRSFAIVQEGAFRSITLLPLKRFQPAISLYYAPDDESAIMEAFGGLLPQETRQPDPLDKLMQRIRF